MTIIVAVTIVAVAIICNTLLRGIIDIMKLEKKQEEIKLKNELEKERGEWIGRKCVRNCHSKKLSGADNGTKSADKEQQGIHEDTKGANNRHVGKN